MVQEDKFDSTSTTKFRKLTIKFNTYKKHLSHLMTQHLMEMSNMVRDLKLVEYNLTNEQ